MEEEGAELGGKVSTPKSVLRKDGPDCEEQPK